MINIDKCLLCGSDRSMLLYDNGVALDSSPNTEVLNRICLNCGLVFQSPRPDFNELKEYYGNYMQNTQNQSLVSPWFEEFICSISRMRLEYIRPFINDGDSILDVGCSFGAMLKILKDESGLDLSLTGVNPEDALAEFGREKYDLNIITGMFEEQKFSPESFDLIILDNVIEHFDDPSESVSKLRVLLKKQGRIFIVTNNIDTPHGNLWQNFFPDHTVTYSQKTLKAQMESQGFRILDMNIEGHTTYENYHYPYQYCVAEKGEDMPQNYDFHKNGDDADQKIAAINQYLQNSQISNWKKFLAKFLKLAPEEKPISNHTFPPEKYFYRRVMICECSSVEDINLAIELFNESNWHPLLYILFKTENAFKLTTFPPAQANLFKGKSVFVNAENLLTFLTDHLPKIDETFILKMQNADLKKDFLRDCYSKFQSQNTNFGYIDFSFFTNATFFFAKGNENIKNLSSNEYIQKLRNNPEFQIWPDNKILTYCFKERFNEYFPYPKSINLDLNPSCNKLCDKCQFHSPRSQFAKEISNEKIMPVEMAKEILKEAADWPKMPVFSPTYSGEPLKYPYLEEILTYAKNLNYSISITTNGALLDEKRSKMLVRLGIDSMTFSIDAHKPDTYSLLQPPDPLEKVLENINRFLELNENTPKPAAASVHFVMEERNQAEFDDYLAYWKKKVNSVSMAIMQDQFSNCSLVLPPFFKLGKRHACWAAWNCLYIRWNGDISFCGFDIAGKTSNLNVKNMSLHELWTSEKFWKWRNAQLENDMKTLYCKGCPDWSGTHSISTDKDDFKFTSTPLSEIYSKL